MVSTSRRLLLKTAVVISALTPCLAIGHVALADGGLRIQGSTTFFSRFLRPHLRRLEDTAAIKLQVVANKSVWGLIALLEDRADLAMISADLAGEVEIAKKKSPSLSFADLREFRISEARTAFAVHPSNPVRFLSNAQLKGILTGTIKHWRDVGGPDLPIKVVATQDGGGTIVAVRAQLLDGSPIAPEAIRPESARHVVQIVSQEPAAIGIAQESLARDFGLVDLQTDKPVVQTLTLVAREPISREVQAVIDAALLIAKENPL